MHCIKCDFEAPITDFRYLYNARIDSSISIRQCPKCAVWLSVDELKGEVGIEVGPGEAPWGKSAGIESLADDLVQQQ